LISELDDNDTPGEDEELEVNAKVDEFLLAKGIDISKDEE
jgi:hypothetical protein